LDSSKAQKGKKQRRNVSCEQVTFASSDLLANGKKKTAMTIEKKQICTSVIEGEARI